MTEDQLEAITSLVKNSPIDQQKFMELLYSVGVDRSLEDVLSNRFCPTSDRYEYES